MNDPHNPSQPADSGETSAEAETHSHSDPASGAPSGAAGTSEAENDTTREAFEDLVRAAKDAFKSGSRDARDAARRVIPAAREGFGKGLHDLAYGLAYGLTFGATLAREIAPEPLKTGFSEGKSAGGEAAESFVEKRRRSAEARNASVAPSDDPADVEAPGHGKFGDDEDHPGEPVFV